MNAHRHVVLDVGKTMTKLTLWSADGVLLGRETRANAAVDGGGYTALDVEGIDAWLATQLRVFAKNEPIATIVPVAHGAAAAVIRDGALACAPLDYEQDLPDLDEARYAADRGPFAETGSPRLPLGLNLGAQLAWLEGCQPHCLALGTTILLWPQYWAWRLSGVMASEVTSLGCHSDLWNPASAAPSRLAQARGWAGMLPPLRRAGDVLGTISPEWSARTGLPDSVRILCGLHDSNAALLAARGFAEIDGREATILSTGTWFVAMRSPGTDAATDVARLPEARDCLVNVDVAGRAVPSSRFMGGREIAELTGLDMDRIDIRPDQPAIVAATAVILAADTHVLPTFAPGVGPFPYHEGRWVGEPGDGAERRAAVSLYAALVADAALDLIGARERILVEGRFAEAAVLVRALAALRPEDVIYRAEAQNDVSFGALRLIDPDLRPSFPLERVGPLEGDLAAYRDVWRDRIGAMEMAA